MATKRKLHLSMLLLVIAISGISGSKLHQDREKNREGVVGLLQRLHETQNSLESQMAQGRARNRKGRELLTELETDVKEICHARILKHCAGPVFSALDNPHLHHKQKCTIRQEFLFCMMEKKKKSCLEDPDSDPFIKDEVETMKKGVTEIMQSFGVCVRGVRVTG